MSKPKLMDYDIDWELIKNTQLNFLIEEDTKASVGIDHRFASYEKKGEEVKEKPAVDPAMDRREVILRAIVGVAGFN